MRGGCINDNRDNLRPNQHPGALKGYYLQQHKQLKPTTIARATTQHALWGILTTIETICARGIN